MEDSALAERGNMREGPKFDDFALSACKFSAPQQILTATVRCGWRDDKPMKPCTHCGSRIMWSQFIRKCPLSTRVSDGPQHASHVPDRIFRPTAKYMKRHGVVEGFVCFADPAWAICASHCSRGKDSSNEVLKSQRMCRAVWKKEGFFSQN